MTAPKEGKRRAMMLRGALWALGVSACASVPVGTPIGGRSPVERWAFTAPWDARSAASVREHASALDALVLDWVALDSVTGRPLQIYPESLGLSLPSGPRKMALVTSYATDHFSAGLIRRLALDSVALNASASAIAARVIANGSTGMVIDFEGMTRADSALTRAVVATVAGKARARGISPIAIALPAGDTAAYPARLFAASADLFVIMLYDEHWATSGPGAIASPQWVRQMLAMRVAESGASRLVAALPLYGYQWRGNTSARPISFDNARRLATEAGVALERDPSTGSLHATRPDPNGWEAWVSDATQLVLLTSEVAALGVRRIAYWRLGLEDPAMWR